MVQDMVKICPACQLQSPLDAQTCARCGHAFRTKFSPPQSVTQPVRAQRRPPAWWVRYRGYVAAALGVAAVALALTMWYRSLFPPIVGYWRSANVWLDIKANGEAVAAIPTEYFGRDEGLRDLLFDGSTTRPKKLRWRTRSTLLYLTDPMMGRETEPMRFIVSEDRLTMTLYLGKMPLDFYRAD